MRQTLLIALLVPAITICKSQEIPRLTITKASPKPRAFIVFGVAPAFPLGSYNSADPADDNGEFAAIGFAFKADAGYNFGVRRCIGINTSVIVARSYGDEEAFARAINNDVGETKYPGFLNTFIIPGVMFTSWGKTKSAKNKFTFDLNVQPFGLAISTHKGVAASAIDTIISIDQSTDIGWAYKFGIAIRVMRMKHLVISGFIDYMGALVTRKNVATRVNGAIVHTSNYDSNPKMLTVGLGLGFYN